MENITKKNYISIFCTFLHYVHIPEGNVKTQSEVRNRRFVMNIKFLIIKRVNK